MKDTQISYRKELPRRVTGPKAEGIRRGRHAMLFVGRENEGTQAEAAVHRRPGAVANEDTAGKAIGSLGVWRGVTRGD